RVPAPGWKPAGWTPSARAISTQAKGDVTATRAIRTPQFFLLWIVLFTNVTAGIGILEQASPMIQDFFSSVTPQAAAGFVGLLSLANLSGRLGWSTLSDRIGRKRAYMLYLGTGAVLYTGVATLAGSSVALFVVLTFFILTFYGGGFATIPAYLQDLFGRLEVGAIHGRPLTAWSAAAVAGPLIVTAIADSRSAQGVTGQALYIPSLLVMVGVLAIGFTANLLVRPVDARHHVAATTAAAQGHADDATYARTEPQLAATTSEACADPDRPAADRRTPRDAPRRERPVGARLGTARLRDRADGDQGGRTVRVSRAGDLRGHGGTRAGRARLTAA